MSLVANPILPGCRPDPSICRVGEDYYLVTSTFEYFPGLPVFRSRDLAHWQQIGHVIDRPGQIDLAGLPSSSGLFAPTIRHHDGRFWVICTRVDQRDERADGGHFIVTATDAAGPWSDPVWLDADGIDPSLFFDDDGRIWVHATRPARQPAWHDQTEVWLRELDPATMALIGPEHVLWSGAVRDAVWAEGPHLYKVDGRYYLLAAEGGTEYHHAVSVARADAVTGPYLGNRANPVLTHRMLGHDAEVVGVGHADLVQAADGSWWATALGMRPYGGYHYNLGRETFLVPVSWEDGWPVFAPGVGRVETQVEVPFAETGAGAGKQAGSGTLVPPADPRWTSLRGPADAFASPAGDGWTLRLGPARLHETSDPAFLGIRQQHRDAELCVVLRAELTVGEEAGLAIRQSDETHVRLHLAGPADADGRRRVVAVERQRGVESVLGEALVPLSADGALALAVRARGQDYALIAGAGLDETVVAVADGRRLDSIAAGGFLGLWLGVYGTSNGAATTTAVLVERVDYREL